MLMIVLTQRLSKKSLMRPPNAIEPIMKFNGIYGTKSANWSNPLAPAPKAAY